MALIGRWRILPVRPLFRCFRPFIGPILNACFGSNPALQYSVQTDEPNRKIQARKP